MAKKILLDKEQVIRLLNKDMSNKEICQELNVGYSTLGKFLKENDLVNPHKRVMTDEEKRKISEGRKRWLKKNPDKHPWKRRDKFKSEPCENLKSILKSHGVQFIEEYSPEIEGRYFSIDIALPDKMIAIEVNGNQHYKRDGRLKPYYKEREELLEKAGWDVYQVHYSACFSAEKWIDFLNRIKNSESKVEFDYFEYQVVQKNKLAPVFCPSCGVEIAHESKLCKKCTSVERAKSGDYRNFNWPSKEELTKLIWEMPTTRIAEKFGVSDSAINRVCKRYSITKPPQGYWSKINSGWTEEEALHGKPQKPKPRFLSKQDKDDIRLKFANGMSRRELSNLYKRDVSIIGKIINGKL